MYAYLNPYIFFFFHNGELILWDYKNHQQFALEPAYIQRLLALSLKPEFQEKNPIDKDLLDGGILTHTPPMDTWGWDRLSQIFHMGTSLSATHLPFKNYSEYLEQYISLCETEVTSGKIPNPQTEKSGQEYLLPSPDLTPLQQKNFLHLLQSRMTSRFFHKDRSLSLAHLSTLLYVTFADIDTQWPELQENGLHVLSVHKFCPSGGGLHPSEAYIVANNINGLPPGIYHYRSHQHVLTHVSEAIPPDELSRLLSHQSFAKDLPLGIFVTSRFDKLWSKYPNSRAYRIALLDIGHLSQNFQLCATALNLECWLTGAFLDDDINQLLPTDSSEQVLFFMGAGYGEHQCLDNEARQYLQKKILHEI